MDGSIKVPTRRWLLPGAVTFGTSLFIAALAGCGDDDEVGPGDTDSGTDAPINPNDTGGSSSGDTGGPDGGSSSGDNGNVTSVAAAANSAADFHSPFDSTPDPTGATVFFTAIAADGTSGVFKAPATGGAVTKLFSGSPLVTPMGIACTVDGTQLFIADPAAATGADRGQIYVLPAGGGTPTPFGGTEGYQPKSIVISGANLFFTGIDKADGKPGIFKVAVTGGAITVISSGGSITDPSGVAASPTGDVYFADNIGASPYASVYKVAAAGGAPTVVLPNYKPGWPAGVALSGDGKALLASSISRTTYKDEVQRVDLVSNQITQNSTGAIGANIEAAGLHRAANANVYSWVDSLAGGTGTIYVLK